MRDGEGNIEFVLNTVCGHYHVPSGGPVGGNRRVLHLNMPLASATPAMMPGFQCSTLVLQMRHCDWI